MVFGVDLLLFDEGDDDVGYGSKFDHHLLVVAFDLAGVSGPDSFGKINKHLGLFFCFKVLEESLMCLKIVQIEPIFLEGPVMPLDLLPFPLLRMIGRHEIIQ
jgi:hypothetical protein